VKFSLWPTEHQGKAYARFTPFVVQVTDLVLFGGNDGDGFDEEDGYESIVSPSDVQAEAPSAPEDGEAPVDPGDF